jgi:hypothetical protein
MRQTQAKNLCGVCHGRNYRGMVSACFQHHPGVPLADPAAALFNGARLILNWYKEICTKRAVKGARQGTGEVHD